MKLRKTFVATLCATSAIVCGAMAPLQGAIAQEKPNFITIVIDDMGYSDLGIFGGEAETPNLDKLASEGMVMTNFYAGSSSSPSRAMLFSGKDNHNAGLGDMRENMGRDTRVEQENQPGYEGVLSLDVPPFPQLLQDNNYYTMMTGKWHMGGDEEDEEEYYAINRGFSETMGLLLGGGDLDFMISAEGKFLTEHPLDHMHGRQSLYNTNGEETDFSELPPLTHSTTYYTDNAMKMLDNVPAGTPFYLNISYLAPHMPLQAPKEIIDKYVDIYSVGWEKIREQRLNKLKDTGYVPQDVELSPRPGDVKAWKDLSDREKQLEAKRMAVYTAEVDFLDQNIGRLIEDLKARGVYDNTVFFVYSDNGPANSGFAAPPEGVTNHNTMIAQGVDNLSEAEFQEMMDTLGSATSWLSPTSGWGHVTNVPFSYYKADTYDGGTRGAAFVNYPKSNVSGVTTNCLYSVMDIAPTVLEMAGAEYPTKFNNKTNKPMDGVSMAGVFEGNLVCNPERWLGFEVHGIKGLRKGNWKLSQANGMGGIVGLYNIWEDPFEQNDLSAEMPAKYQEMMDVYAEYAEKNGVVEINNLSLPDLADSDKTTAKIRGGIASVLPSGRTGPFSADASLKPGALVSVAGEIRPQSEHVGMPAMVYARAEYTVPGREPIFFWSTESGTSIVTDFVFPFKPFKEVSALPSMITIPIYDGTLPEEATIEVTLGYMLEDGFTIVDNFEEGTPLKVKVSND